MAARSRGGLKMRLTCFGKYLDDIQINQNALDDAKLDEIAFKLKKIESINEQFEAYQCEIEAAASDEDFENELLYRQSFEQTYCDLIYRAKRILAPYMKQRVGGSVAGSLISHHSSHSNSKHSNNTVHSQQPQSHSHLSPNADNSNLLQLPRVKLQTFSGAQDDWLEFRELFIFSVHKRQNLSNIEKYQYLKLSLEGEAAQVIKSLEFTASSYDSAWELICDRYNNERLLVDNHVNALFNIEHIQKPSTAKLRNLIDTIGKHLRALSSLGQPTETWDTLLIHMIKSKLDITTVREWEEYKISHEIPDLSDLKHFLKGRADILEALNSNKLLPVDNSKKQKSTRPFTSKTYHTAERSDPTCIVCKGNHFPYSCTVFLALSPHQRFEKIKSLRACLNCFKPGHSPIHCKSSSCRKCGRKHNTLVHLPYNNVNQNQQSNNQKIATSPISDISNPTEISNLNLNTANNTNTMNSYTISKSYILLSTAWVKVSGKGGPAHECRVLLDCASQSNYISENLCNILNLPRKIVNYSVSGIGQMTTHIKHQVVVKIQSFNSNFKADLSCLVIKEVSGVTPSVKIDPKTLGIPISLQLADPYFYEPREVDLLIGADTFWDLLLQEKKQLGKRSPVLRETRLGWIVGGPLPLSNSAISDTNCLFTKNQDLHNSLKEFWEIEELSLDKPFRSQEETSCEKHFTENTIQDHDGRFIVKLPLKAEPSLLGDSKQSAIKRFCSLESRFQKNPDLQEQYIAFMREYEQLGHMTKIQDENEQGNVRYFIPHHAVVKAERKTTKLRVVFDASAKTSSNYSLNDLQLVGPCIQQELFEIVLRFRKHKVVLTADVTKMYRQILVNKEQRPLQCIVWRENPDESLQIFELNTVTYGQAASSFLATRCLQQTSHNHVDKYPNSSSTIIDDFYIDDLLTGADSIENAIELRHEITDILNSGCFPLRKWISNQPEALKELATSSPSSLTVLEIGPNEKTKTLGLLWDPNQDIFAFSIKITSDQQSCTKRTILSCIAQIFDPLGLLSPITILAKILIQKLWELNVDWDDPLPSYLYTQWCQFYSELPYLNHLAIQRRITCDNPTRIEVHGFADASQKAYGACIYIKSIHSNGQVYIRLLCSKSKVSPLKSITIPRLELCAALILSKLVKKALFSLKMHIDETYYWTDSTVVLGWIKTSPNLLKTFVSNRVTEIQELTDISSWHHVKGEDNPADLVSRGLRPSLLIESERWLQGPEWLSENPTRDAQTVEIPDELPDTRKSTLTLVSVTPQCAFPFERFSNFTKMLRTSAYVLRFSGRKYPKGNITTDELQASLIFLVKLAQRQTFLNEIHQLSKGKSVASKSKLRRLNPFIHTDGTMRVGGRLHHSDFHFNKKHPIVLDSSHQLTHLLFLHEHKRLLHAGPQILLASLREKFWPITGRNLAKKVVHACIPCFKSNPRFVQPIMGNLPKNRVTFHHPFYTTGVDYAGPFAFKDHKGRGCKTRKCYICLFICFTTKSIHLELVTALSTDAFMLALRRFISRRGRPYEIYSDNGTNFVGASNELNELGNFLLQNQNVIQIASTNETINWHFIPAYSPHMGGLWEAGVKSCKYHLKRVAGSSSFTFEEFYSLLTQIEAVLNSRRLSPLSEDPSDCTPLTPSHFLIGRPTTAIPSPNLSHIADNRLNVYQKIEQMRQHFWQRWNLEYISELQQRVKWKESRDKLILGSLVLIKEENLPPNRWSLGRVTELHLGDDGVARVVTLSTNKGATKRSFSKICPLPLNNVNFTQATV